MAITLSPMVPIGKPHYCMMDINLYSNTCQTFIWTMLPKEICLIFSIIFGICTISLTVTYE